MIFCTNVWFDPNHKPGRVIKIRSGKNISDTDPQQWSGKWVLNTAWNIENLILRFSRQRSYEKYVISGSETLVSGMYGGDSTYSHSQHGEEELPGIVASQGLLHLRPDPLTRHNLQPCTIHQEHLSVMCEITFDICILGRYGVSIIPKYTRVKSKKIK